MIRSPTCLFLNFIGILLFRTHLILFFWQVIRFGSIHEWIECINYVFTMRTKVRLSLGSTVTWAGINSINGWNYLFTIFWLASGQLRLGYFRLLRFFNKPQVLLDYLYKTNLFHRFLAHKRNYRMAILIDFDKTKLSQDVFQT